MNHAAFKGTILIVEDDQTSCLLSTYFEQAGFKTICAYDGGRALKLFQQHKPAFVILNPLLPNVDGRVNGWVDDRVDGREVYQELRRLSDVPILILTARGETQNSVVWLTLGADDCVTKPVSPDELVARVKAILRRAQLSQGREAEVLSHCGLTLNLEKHKVILHGTAVALTRSEFKLLKALMSAPGRIFHRQELIDCLYPTGEAVVDRVVDVHIGNLRQKIEKDPSRPGFISTVRGMGYKFVDSDEQPKEWPEEWVAGQAEDRCKRSFEIPIPGIYQTTFGGRYLTACPMLARMFAYKSAEELIEDTINLNHGFYVEAGRRTEFACLVREHQWVPGFESEIYRRDGSRMWISEYALAVCDTAGKLVGFQGTTIDVTERKQAEKALQPGDNSSGPRSLTYH